MIFMECIHIYIKVEATSATGGRILKEIQKILYDNK